MKEGMFLITSNGDYTWTETKAKTLKGAKRLASMMFQTSFDGVIRVGIARDHSSIDAVAVRRGFGDWTEA